MTQVPNVGDHGHILADVLKDTGVTVVEVTEDSVQMKFDSDTGENVFPVGLEVFQSGRFIEMDE
jgi:hypothetical protein